MIFWCPIILANKATCMQYCGILPCCTGAWEQNLVHVVLVVGLSQAILVKWSPVKLIIWIQHNINNLQ